MALSKSLLSGIGRKGSNFGSDLSKLGEDDTNQNLDNSINNSYTRLAAIGADAPTPKETTLTKILKNIGRTGYGATNLLREFTNPEQGNTSGTFDPLAAFRRGFNLEETPTGKDVAQDMGLSGTKGVFGGESKWYNPSPAGIAGFALDVVNPLDPMNWLTFGLGGAAKSTGVKGVQALEKAFGTKSADIIAKLGSGALSDVGADSVGKLMARISKIATDAEVSKPTLDGLLNSMREGLQETGLKATSKIKYNSSKPVTIGLQNPLSLGIGKNLTEAIIPGSEKLTAPITKATDAFMNTRVGDTLGKMFSNKYVPKTVPDSVIVREVTDFAKDAVNNPNVMKESLKTNSGNEIYQKFRNELTNLFEVTSHNETDFTKQVETLFSNVPLKERKMITDLAAQTSDEVIPDLSELSESGKNAYDAFIKWRESIVKTYQDMQIPMTALEKYVPFIPVRALKDDERSALRALYGTTVKDTPNVDDILSLADSNLMERTTKGVTRPKEINDLLGKEWLTEDAALAMAMRGTRAIKSTEVNKFLEGFMAKYGLEYKDLVRSQGVEPGRSFDNALHSSQLPKDLSGAKPRYGYKDKNFKLNFESDVDKALYIVAQTKKSARDADYRNFIKQALGDITDQEIDMLSSQVRNSVSELARQSTGSTLSIAKSGLSVPGRVMTDLGVDTSNVIPEGYKMYLTNIDSNGKSVLEEVRDAAKLAGKAEPVLLPEEMANIYNQYAEMIFGGGKKNPLLQLYDAATSAYKKVSYLWNPGHVPRDFIGNIFNGYLMGVTNPMEYIKASEYMRNPQAIIRLPGGDMTAEKLLEQAKKLGVLDVGASFSETPKGMIERMNLPGSNIAKKAIAGYSNIMRKGTEITDTLTRLTGLVHELQQGKSLLEAATNVKKFYFDYFDLTPFERKVMKRVMPFYTWIRKNLPLQVEQLIKQPRAYARIGDMQNAAAGESVDMSERPEFIQNAGAIQLGKNGDYISPSLPYTDLDRLPTGLSSLLATLSGVNPIIRAPIESATNTQWFTGRNLEDYEGQTQDMPLSGLLKYLGIKNVPQMSKRVGGQLLNQIPVLRNIDVMTNPDKPDKQVSRFSSFIGGPSIYTKEGVETSKKYETKKQLDAELRKLKDQGEEVPTMKDLKKKGNYKKWQHLGK